MQVKTSAGGNSELGTRNPERGTEDGKPGTRNPERGTDNGELGTRNSELGANIGELRTRNPELAAPSRDVASLSVPRSAFRVPSF
jgi:hypothetical protein